MMKPGLRGFLVSFAAAAISILALRTEYSLGLGLLLLTLLLPLVVPWWKDFAGCLVFFSAVLSALWAQQAYVVSHPPLGMSSPGDQFSGAILTITSLIVLGSALMRVFVQMALQRTRRRQSQPTVPSDANASRHLRG